MNNLQQVTLLISVEQFCLDMSAAGVLYLTNTDSHIPLSGHCCTVKSTLPSVGSYMHPDARTHLWDQRLQKSGVNMPGFGPTCSIEPCRLGA